MLGDVTPCRLQAVFLLLFIAYPMVSLKTFRLFRCTKIDGVRYLVADLRQECFTPQWCVHSGGGGGGWVLNCVWG